ncbi:MAG: nicotinate phosphoribosyltransferase [Candidatus Micrarchaeota archaeon]|nr:nicotinate phosphoribosyltransferase [Candidatus Micrarchaeota archaeon]
MEQEYNLLLQADGYKNVQWRQFPDGTQNAFMYLESREGAAEESVFFGLQYIMKRYFQGKVVTEAKVREAEETINGLFGTRMFNTEGWEHIIDAHGGMLPISIRAVPEGLVVPAGNVMLTVENTDPQCFWLPSYIETVLGKVWYPITIASTSYRMRGIISEYVKRTGDEGTIDQRLYDNSKDGVSSNETSAIAGAAHLLSFRTTDSVAAIELLKRYYHYKGGIFTSVPGTEHISITTWGKTNEEKAMGELMQRFRSGPLSIVVDSYDLHGACRDILGTKLKSLVVRRDGNIIVRPDSGDPVEVALDVIGILGDSFGFDTNRKGFKVLKKTRISIAEATDSAVVSKLLSNLEERGLSADNIIFGTGGSAMQRVTKDSHRIAARCSSITVNGAERDVYKEPKTALWKRSKPGRLALVSDGYAYRTLRRDAVQPGEEVTAEVFSNGRLLVEHTIEDIRSRVLLRQPMRVKITNRGA